MGLKPPNGHFLNGHGNHIILMVSTWTENSLMICLPGLASKSLESLSRILSTRTSFKNYYWGLGLLEGTLTLQFGQILRRLNSLIVSTKASLTTLIVTRCLTCSDHFLLTSKVIGEFVDYTVFYQY